MPAARHLNAIADLDPAVIRAGLAECRIRWRIVVHAAVASTMDTLGALAEAGAPEGTVVIADHQSAGRGRLQRSWLAPPGTSLTLSLLFRPTVAADRYGEVMMAVALGALDALATVLPPAVPTALKWPNDVLAGGLKIAGLLAEARLTPGGAGAVIVGLGLNVRQTGDDLPPGATSVAALGVILPSRVPLAAALLASVDRHYERLLTGGSLIEPWAARLDTIGRAVVATGAGATVHGTAVGVAPDGGLQIATPGGAIVTVHAGDVTITDRR